MGNHPVAQAAPVAFVVVVEEFHLHLGHVHAGGAFALAALAAHAFGERVVHLVRGQRILAELAGQGQAQRVGPPAGHVALVLGRAIGRAHHRGVELATGAVVVAHLHRRGEAAVRRPVERGLDRNRLVLRVEAHETGVVHARRVHDLVRVEQAVRVEGLLDLLERADQSPAVHRLVEFGTGDAVAVLARMRALVFAHQREGFLGDRPHLGRAGRVFQVDDRAHVQTALGGMGIPGAFGAVLVKDLGEALGIVGQIGQGHRAVLDEGDRLTVALHRHHDIQPGLAHAPDLALLGGRKRFDHAVRIAEIAHQFDQLRQMRALFVEVVAGEFHQQHGLRLAADIALHDRAEDIDLAAQADERGIDQFHRRRFQAHDRLCGLHGLAKGREMTHAQHLVLDRGLQVDLDLLEEAQRAFRAHQQAGEIGRAIRLVRRQLVEVVAAHAAIHVREEARQLVGLAGIERAHLLGERAIGRRGFRHGLGIVDAAEMMGAAVGQHRVHRARVVDHVAVAQAARAAAVVAGHAAERGACAGGHIHRVHQPVRREFLVQGIQRDARLDHGDTVFDIERDQRIQILAGIQHQRFVDRLAVLRGAAAARQYRHALAAGDLQRADDIGLGARHDHAMGAHLVDRGIGAVAPAREFVEQHLGLQFVAQAPFERRLVV